MMHIHTHSVLQICWILQWWPWDVRSVFWSVDKKEKYTSSLCTSGRRKSVAPQEQNKGNKRLSCVTKPTDVQTKRGKVRFFTDVLPLIYLSFFNWKSVSWLELLDTRNVHHTFLHSLLFPSSLVWRGLSAKPEVLWDDPRLQRDLGNKPYVNFWPCKFGLKNVPSM